MSFDPKDEILRDFLVEASEILDLLSSELIQLENHPDNYSLLNSIFRHFHTIKGGAGFLQIMPLVELCHICENVFDKLRNSEIKVTPELTDVVFEALDCIHSMFNQIKNFDMPSSADLMLLERLRDCENNNKSSINDRKEHTKIPEKPNDGLISDEQFESLLDQLHGSGGIPGIISSRSSSPEIPLDGYEAEKTSFNKSNISLPIAENNISARPISKEPTVAINETTVKVDTKRLDDIMNMVGELVLVRNRLVRLGLQSRDENISKMISSLDVVTADLQTAVMKTRMQPIKRVFGRFPRLIRDLSRNLKKEINLTLIGEETDLDKNLVDELVDPLIHLVRNSVDHGIEMPVVRERQGKSRIGSIILAARQEGDHIVLSIFDDGTGMDPEILRAKAVEKKIIDIESSRRLSKDECFNLIFEPGFSTRDTISMLSGRGVGMDVVKTRILQLGGTVNIRSLVGKGTEVSVKVPLTLAIMPTLMVTLKNQVFAFPLVSVSEIFQVDMAECNHVDGVDVVLFRGNPLPVFQLGQWLINGYQPVERGIHHIVVINIGAHQVGFVVDKLIGQEEVVVKRLGVLLHKAAGMAGATITGDGRIALILDVPALMESYACYGVDQPQFDPGRR